VRRAHALVCSLFSSLTRLPDYGAVVLFRKLAIWAFGLWIVTGCRSSSTGDVARATWASIGRHCPAGAPAVVLSPERRDSLPPDPGLTNSDSRWAWIARVVPGGWGGGIFLDSGFANYYLRDTMMRAAAEGVLNEHRVDGRVWGPPMHVRVGRWSFAELYDWDRYLRPRVGNVSFSGYDIDEAHNRLLYSLTTAAAKRDLERRLADLGGPCFLVAIEIRPMAVPAASANVR
jgi:hypothetical protein